MPLCRWLWTFLCTRHEASTTAFGTILTVNILLCLLGTWDGAIRRWHTRGPFSSRGVHVGRIYTTFPCKVS